MCRFTTISAETTCIKPPLRNTANLLDAIQAKLYLRHYRLPQRFLFLHRIRSSYNCLLGLPQQGCKYFCIFGVLVRLRQSGIGCPYDWATVADSQKQWKDIRAKYTEAVEE